jgi:branched-subunit amino acid ABC-type transport system permease component
MPLNRPSSTITAATLAGMGAALAWELVATFTEIEPSAGLISGSTVFVSSLVGFLKKENVLGK